MSFCPFLLVIVSYVLLRLMASDYSSGILKPFFRVIHIARSLVFCVVFCRLLFILFRLAIVLYFSYISVISWRGIISKGIFSRGRGFYCYSIVLYFSNISVISWRGIISKGLFYNKIFKMFQMYECGILWTFFYFIMDPYVRLYQIRIINLCQMNHIHTSRGTRVGLHVQA